MNRLAVSVLFYVGLAVCTAFAQQPKSSGEQTNLDFIYPSDGTAQSESVRDLRERVSSFDFHFGGPYFADGCTLGAATLTVFDDGRVHWRANSVMSRDDNEDSWLATFEFYDNHGIRLWQFGRISSPTLHPTPLVWINNTQLFYPSYMFQSIAQARMIYHC